MSPRSVLVCTVLLAASASAQNTPFLVADIYAGSGDSNPSHLTVVGDQLFLLASAPTVGQELFVSDGLAGGTTQVVADLDGWWMEELTALDDTLLYRMDTGSGLELWRSDGTAAGTYVLTNVSDPVNNLFRFGPWVYFSADEQLWRSDGTVGGTGLFTLLFPWGSGANPDQGTIVGNRFFFNATDLSAVGAGREPWVSDGTPGGTYMVKDVFPGTNNSTAQLGVEFNGLYYFPATDGVTGMELHRSDGTAAGTWLVKDVWPGGSYSYPRDLCVSGGLLYFTADDGTNGRELWASDGTTGGTYLVKDLAPGNVFFPVPYAHLTDVDGTLFFAGNDGVNGQELWKSDGTAAGTVLVKDMQSGSADGWIDNPLVIAGEFYFTARSNTYGAEIFKSDGTEAGTLPVIDLNPGSGWSWADDVIVWGEHLYFSAEAPGGLGNELYAVKLCELQAPASYCTPGTTASGCQAAMSGSGTPSASSPSGFVVDASGAEGAKDGLFFFGANGRQANPWGTSSSFQCVVPPVKRSSLQNGGGTAGLCDGTFQIDFNDLITTHPNKHPGSGALVQIQCWFRDPFNTSNQTTSFSDALEFTLCP